MHPFIGAILAMLVMLVTLVGVIAQLGIAIEIIFLAALAAAIRPSNIEANGAINAPRPIFGPDIDIARRLIDSGLRVFIHLQASILDGLQAFDKPIKVSSFKLLKQV